MADEQPFRVGRSADSYRVHGTDAKRRRERKDDEEHEFKDVLMEAEKETEDFDSGPEQEQKPSVPNRAMLDQLSAGAPPLIIESAETPPPKAETTPEKKESTSEKKE